MATATSSPVTDYRQEWFEIEDATYLNLAAQSPMPKVSHRTVQTAIEWKKFPHRIADSAYFEVPNRIRASIGMVRFDNGVLLDAARIAAACHAQGALLLLDVSQCCGGMPLDVTALGADFMVCAGYKWLLSPYGTGFFWAKNEHTDKMRPGPFYWAA